MEPGTGAVLPPPVTGLKLTRGRATSTVARYLHSASTNTGHYHHHHHGLHGQYPPGSTGRPTGRHHQHHHPSRGSFSNETQEEVQEDDEATLRELLVRYVSPTYPTIYIYIYLSLFYIYIYTIIYLFFCEKHLHASFFLDIN